MFFLFTFAALAGTHSVQDKPSTKPTLSGIVQSAAGKPIAGANVLIRTAGPRQGVGYL